MVTFVFKNGEVVGKDGEIIQIGQGVIHTVKPEYDASIEKSLKKYFDDYQTISLPNFKISNDEMIECIGSEIVTHPCK